MQVNFNKKIFFTVFAIIALNAAMVLFAVAPIVSEIEAAGLRMHEQREKIAGYERRNAAVREFAAFAKDEKNNLESIEKTFINARLPLDFINFIEGVARDAAVAVEFSSSAVQSKKDDVRPMIGIEASVKGDAENVLHFIKKIELSPYLVEIQNADIKIDTLKENELKAEKAAQNGTSTAEIVIPDSARPAEAHILLKAYAK